MKSLLLLLLISITSNAQLEHNLLSGENTTLVDSFALLGESVADLFIDPKIEGRLIATTGNVEPKIKISTDYGKNWVPATINTSMNTQPHISAFDITFNTSNYDTGFVAAGIDLYKTTDRGLTWDSTGFSDLFPEYDLRNWGDISFVTVNPYNPALLFISNTYPYQHETDLFRSEDGGKSWSIVDSATSYEKLIFDPQNSNIVYGISLFTNIKKSIDGGTTWETINNNLVFSVGNISDIEIYKNEPSILYCAQFKYWDDEDEQNPARLSITINGGDSWERIDSTLLAIDPNGSVYDILLDPNIEGRFYVAYTGGLYLTEDNGKHYQKIYSGDAKKIWSDNKTPATIYFNSDKGLLSFKDTFVVSIKSSGKNIINNFQLHQNYPNPFNPSTTIKYSIPTPPASSPLVKGRTEVGFVTLKVYDVLGREIATLVNKKQSPGNYTVIFNAKNLPSGLYFYRLTAGSFSQTKKMLLLK